MAVVMIDIALPYALLAGLAIALLVATVTDVRSRTISNRLNMVIAAGAPAFWMASGLALWPDIAIQLGLAAGIFALFLTMFAIGVMGGGDVKLLTALALWFAPFTMLQLLVIMSVAGGVLTLAMLAHQKIRKQTGPLKIPYGVAITFAGLWVIGERFLNHFH